LHRVERELLQVSEGLRGERADCHHQDLATNRGEHELLWVSVEFRGEPVTFHEVQHDRDRVEQELFLVLAELLDDNRNNLLLSRVY